MLLCHGDHHSSTAHYLVIHSYQSQFHLHNVAQVIKIIAASIAVVSNMEGQLQARAVPCTANSSTESSSDDNSATR
jgi:hypothetical protein